MESVVRAALVYVILLVILRLAGRRTLAEMTSFDFVLLLVIGESTQQALLGDDFSITTAAIVIVTLVGIDIGLSLIKRDFPAVARVIDGVPMVVVDHGRPLRDRMRRARIGVDDVLEAARSRHGLERLEEIKFAVLEISGGISIVPADDPPPPEPEPRSKNAAKSR